MTAPTPAETHSGDHGVDHATDEFAALIEGVIQFRRRVYPERQEQFRRLASGQRPHTLFITCADSRVVPEMITQTDPGQLFVCRNIGNIVPAYGEMMGGVSAIVEYACTALGVSHILVCGHSDCGAMKGLLNPDDPNLRRMPTVASWLRNAEAARGVVEVTRPDLEGAAKVQALVEQNVRLQMQHLRTHPAVAARLAEGSLSLHGWVYNIEDGTVSTLDEAGGEPVPLDKAVASKGRAR
ncbi:MAG: carbonic anhydrase [Acetobacteraceae bacterium]|nr:carbonic anhydrase [Acetobacteraceae bacterium]MBV8520988.1 carbonic anhydrase [Acetobacteraceae bacterium]MBV8591472.1 carbonic anhydrase [Acetobacteraceae bacterium]